MTSICNTANDAFNKCILTVQDFAPDLVVGDVVYSCAMGQSEVLGRMQGRSPPRIPRVLVSNPATDALHAVRAGRSCRRHVK